MILFPQYNFSQLNTHSMWVWVDWPVWERKWLEIEDSILPKQTYLNIYSMYHEAILSQMILWYGISIHIFYQCSAHIWKKRDFCATSGCERKF